MYCGKCGLKADLDGQFCAQCGGLISGNTHQQTKPKKSQLLSQSLDGQCYSYIYIILAIAVLIPTYNLAVRFLLSVSSGFLSEMAILLPTLSNMGIPHRVEMMIPRLIFLIGVLLILRKATSRIPIVFVCIIITLDLLYLIGIELFSFSIWLLPSIPSFFFFLFRASFLACVAVILLLPFEGKTKKYQVLTIITIAFIGFCIIFNEIYLIYWPMLIELEWYLYLNIRRISLLSNLIPLILATFTMIYACRKSSAKTIT